MEKDSIEKLIEEFSQFPGIGPRQAKRIAFYLLTRNENKLKLFTNELLSARKKITHCSVCNKLFVKSRNTTQCTICSDTSRDTALLMVVGHDVDIESIEKSGCFNGYYFVLGGNIPILEEKPEKFVRLAELRKVIVERTKNNLQEIILALDANPEGEYTSNYLFKHLSPLLKEKNIAMTTLGRGLSTGTELQYSDPETIKSALKNRMQAK